VAADIASPRAGRPPSTSAGRLEQIAFDLFTQHGFDETTLEDVAAAAGISKRTFFRYHRSKNDLVWGDFDVHLATFRDELTARDGEPMMQALRQAVVAFNRVEGEAVVQHRRRMRLILTVPTLQAHSTLRYAAWRKVVEEFAARRSGHPRGTLLPRLVGHLALATSVAAYEQWLAEPDAELEPLIDSAFAALATGFDAAAPASGAAASAPNGAVWHGLRP
jgi:mycofactocin system transcriptional regulator